MTWYLWTEQKRKLLIGGMSTIGFLALLVCARRNIVSADSFWHLRMGKDWIENGLSPWIDHYSFTFAGAEVASPPVLFQATLHWFVAQFGLETGYEILKFVCYALAFGMLLLYLRQIKAPAFIYLIVLPLVIALIELRALVRPELLSYSLSVAALMLYYRAGTEVSSRTVIPMALLMWFWSNYHSPVIGYVIFFGFFVDAGMHQLRSRASAGHWLRWLGWGLVVVAIGAIRPGFTHPMYEMLVFDPEWRTLIQEYQSPLLYRGVAAFYAVIAVTLVACVLSLRQRKFGYLAVILVLVFGASNMARMVTPAGIVIAGLFAHLVCEENWRGWLERSSSLVRNFVGVGVFVLFALSLWTTVVMAREYMAENRRSSVLFPYDVVRYMRDMNRTGRIFNEYHVGGYLIYHASPESKVYIDGRTGILYPADHYKRLKQAQTSAEVLREEVEKHDINLALLENKGMNFFQMDEVGGFGLDYVGATYSLFTSDYPMFPVLGHLLARPACWEERMLFALENEETNAVIHLPRNSALWPFLRAVMGYATAEDRFDYLTEFAASNNPDDNAWRFAAYRALELGADDLALRLLTSVGAKQIKDHMAAALAMIRLGSLEQAEQALEIASTTVWPYLELPDIVIMNGLLQQMQEHRPLSRVTESFVDYVDRQMEEAGLAGKEYTVTSELFCAKEGWQDLL